MRNLFTYYCAIFIPIIALFEAVKMHVVGGWISVALLFFYALIYRTFIDGTKLSQKGLIEPKEKYKVLTKGLHIKYFKELYLQK